MLFGEVMSDKPQIFDYSVPVSFLKARIDWRKQNEPAFSVLRICKSLRRCSPALVSLILKGKRKVTIDRVDDLCKIMDLSALEKQHFIILIEPQDSILSSEPSDPRRIKSGRRHVSTDFLSDWLNVYVKDAFRFPNIQKNPKELYALLAGIAPPKRIDRSLDFLLRYGFLRKTGDGRIIEDFPVHVAEPGKANQRIRNFHKAALKIARSGIEQYDVTERFANASVIPLNPKAYEQLTEIISNFSNELKTFAETNKSEDGRLYQIIVNVTPTGGKAGEK